MQYPLEIIEKMLGLETVQELQKAVPAAPGDEC
jgi:hypothetical protein